MACSSDFSSTLPATPDDTVTDSETSLPQPGDKTDTVLTQDGNTGTTDGNGDNNAAGTNNGTDGENSETDTENAAETAGLSVAETMAIIQRVLN